jgi:hypothetical protein
VAGTVGVIERAAIQRDQLGPEQFQRVVRGIERAFHQLQRITHIALIAEHLLVGRLGGGQRDFTRRSNRIITRIQDLALARDLLRQAIDFRLLVGHGTQSGVELNIGAYTHGASFESECRAVGRSAWHRRDCKRENRVFIGIS